MTPHRASRRLRPWALAVATGWLVLAASLGACGGSFAIREPRPKAAAPPATQPDQKAEIRRSTDPGR